MIVVDDDEGWTVVAPNFVFFCIMAGVLVGVLWLCGLVSHPGMMPTWQNDCPRACLCGANNVVI